MDTDKQRFLDVMHDWAEQMAESIEEDDGADSNPYLGVINALCKAIHEYADGITLVN